MAFSATRVSRQLLGAEAMEIWEVDFSGVTVGTFYTGLGNVRFASCNNEVTEGDGKTQRNSTTGSDTANGSLYLSGFTSNDTGTVMVIGAV